MHLRYIDATALNVQQCCIGGMISPHLQPNATEMGDQTKHFQPPLRIRQATGQNDRLVPATSPNATGNNPQQSSRSEDLQKPADQPTKAANRNILCVRAKSIGSQQFHSFDFRCWIFAQITPGS